MLFKYSDIKLWFFVLGKKENSKTILMNLMNSYLIWVSLNISDNWLFDMLAVSTKH